jgi:hypothetical protein
MSQTITVDGNDRSGVIPRETVEWVEYANVGEIGEGKFTIEDTAGSIEAKGFKDVIATESAASPTRLFTGFAGRKRIVRGPTTNRGASRDIEVGTMDANDLLTRIVIRGGDAPHSEQSGSTRGINGKRPAETVNSRMAWLLDEVLSDVDVNDYGNVASSTAKVDKADYRGEYAIDVLSAIAKAIGFNFYVRWNSTQSGFELVFRDDNTSTDDTCTLSISNVEADLSATVLEAVADMELDQDAQSVYSGEYATHGKGKVYVHDADTAAEFVERDGITEDSGIRTDTTARRDALKALDESDSEEQLLTVNLWVPPAQVNLIRAGMRINTKMSHLTPEGWASGRYARILRARKSMPLDEDIYKVSLDLSPQEAGTAGCVGATESQIFYPLELVDPENNGFQWGVSDGVVYYLLPGLFWPTTPMVGHLGRFNFGTYGAGGEGSTAFAGDCAYNFLQFLVVGNGTLTIQTEVYAGSTRPMAGSWGRSPDAYANSLGTFTSGDVVEAVITGATGNNCISVIRLYDGPGSPCGGKWGFSQAEWVAA